MELEQDHLSESEENYLETIFLSIKEHGAARPKDIVVRLNVSSASVTGALQRLAKKKLVNYAPHELVTLTKKGNDFAEIIFSKHEALFRFFSNILDLTDAKAEAFACKMEHSVPDHVLERFKYFIDFSERCPNSRAIWKEEKSGFFCEKEESCSACTQKEQLRSDL